MITADILAIRKFFWVTLYEYRFGCDIEVAQLVIVIKGHGIRLAHLKRFDL